MPHSISSEISQTDKEDVIKQNKKRVYHKFMIHSFLLIFSDRRPNNRSFQMDGLCFPRDISYHGDSSITNLDLLIFGINYHLAF